MRYALVGCAQPDVFREGPAVSVSSAESEPDRVTEPEFVAKPGRVLNVTVPGSEFTGSDRLRRLAAISRPARCRAATRLGESRAFGNSGAVQSACRYLARIEFDSGAADCFRWPRPGLMALVASQSLPGRAGRVDAPREQRRRSVAPAGTGGPDC
jgi:hypothetical protein